MLHVAKYLKRDSLGKVMVLIYKEHFLEHKMREFQRKPGRLWDLSLARS